MLFLSFDGDIVMLSHVHTSFLLELRTEVNKQEQVGLPLPGVIQDDDWECWD